MLWERTYVPEAAGSDFSETSFGSIDVLSSGSLVAGGSTTIGSQRFA